MSRMIKNCSWGYKCKASWNELVATEDKKIRFCLDCQKEVYSCESQQELKEAIQLNRCVSCPSSLFEPEKKAVVKLKG